MILAPIGLIAFSLSHGTLSWSETQHLRNSGLDEWIQHLTNIQGRWLAAHIGGVALFPLIGMTIWWMLPVRGIFSSVSRVALIVYVPLYIAVDAVLGIGSSILIHYREGLAPQIAPAWTVHSRHCSSRPRPSTGSIKAPALPWKSAHWLPPSRFGETTVGACQCRWPRRDTCWPRVTSHPTAPLPGSRSGSRCGIPGTKAARWRRTVFA